MKTLFFNWNLFRGFRLLLGVAVIVQGLMSGEFLFATIGLVLVVMALANIGCCGSSNTCNVNSEKKFKNDNIYEELADKK